MAFVVEDSRESSSLTRALVDSSLTTRATNLVEDIIETRSISLEGSKNKRGRPKILRTGKKGRPSKR